MFNTLVPFNRRDRELDTMIERFFNDQDLFFSPAVRSGIRVDVKDEGDKYILEAEIPGVKKEDISLNYENEFFTISVEQQEEVNDERENYLCRERRFGKTSRTFHAKDVDPEGIEAAYEDGVLKVTLPKTQVREDKKKIDIK